MPRVLIFCIVFFYSFSSHAQTTNTPDQARAKAQVDALEKPLYNPFVERYVLDDLKQLRVEQAAQKHELMQQILDREHHSVDRAVAYATDTVTYFFYLIAAASSVLVLVGWTSIREMKEKVHSLADEEISKLIREYETRLVAMERQLNQETQNIEDNREEIAATKEMQSLWLRSQQESTPANKIAIYDQLLKLRSDDCEALTYKADAVLELNEPQWCADLCHQALNIDNNNGHAFYQLACAYTVMHKFEEAVTYLGQAVAQSDSYREAALEDEALSALHDYAPFRSLLSLKA